VRAAWEDPVREREVHTFEKLPLSKRAVTKIVEERISRQPVARVTHYAMPPGGPFSRQLQTAGWWKRLAGAGLVHALAYGLGLVAWGFIGQAALTGRWDPGWFWGWAILLAALVPLEALALWWQGWLSIAFGGHLKQRLLAGSLEIDADRVRHQGVGQLLSRVLESEALENVSIAGGAATLQSVVEILAAAVVLSLGAARGLTLTLLAAWLVILLLLARRYARQRMAWVLARNSLTHDLVEKMNGHRTRIAQQPPAIWHTQEDTELVEYLRTASRMDRTHAMLLALGPRGWLTLGVAAVGFTFASAEGAQTSANSIAIALAGVMLGYQALRRFVFGLSQFAAAWQAWSVVRDLFQAATSGVGNQPAPGTANIASSSSSSSSTSHVMEARDVSYKYSGREQNALAGCSLDIRAGDRILLEGSSGSGKSTFGAVLAGLRRPSNGLLLAGGLDPASTGLAGWRKRVATAPQYHENHILAAPLIFNLLMGRNWPPTRVDRKEAVAVCQELGLGPLLSRMPAGLLEMVGDSGWQLSQGERSRIYLARAILQGAPLVILDESFAALDPETLEQCLECALRRAPSLLVIAHP
jgi:ATP-binding cassette, subfamily B, bacterial